MKCLSASIVGMFGVLLSSCVTPVPICPKSTTFKPTVSFKSERSTGDTNTTGADSRSRANTLTTKDEVTIGFELVIEFDQCITEPLNVALQQIQNERTGYVEDYQKGKISAQVLKMLIDPLEIQVADIIDKIGTVESKKAAAAVLAEKKEAPKPPTVAFSNLSNVTDQQWAAFIEPGLFTETRTLAQSRPAPAPVVPKPVTKPSRQQLELLMASDIYKTLAETDAKRQALSVQ